jgi:hypothetical protein
MIEITLAHYLFLSAVIFTLGVFGIFVNRKNVSGTNIYNWQFGRIVN